jgi:hypothetical protein
MHERESLYLMMSFQAWIMERKIRFLKISLGQRVSSDAKIQLLFLLLMLVNQEDIFLLHWFLLTEEVHRAVAADYVVVLDKGRIVQQGTYEQLNSVPGYVRSLNIEDRKKAAIPVEADQPSKEPEEKDPAANLVAESSGTIDDSDRRIGDLAVYQYYIRSIGWLSCMLFVIYITIGTIFSSAMPCKI